MTAVSTQRGVLDDAYVDGAEIAAPGTRSALSTRLLGEAAAEPDLVEQKRLQDEVVIMHMGLARAIAARYRGRGIPEEDLLQAASMALLKACSDLASFPIAW